MRDWTHIKLDSCTILKSNTEAKSKVNWEKLYSFMAQVTFVSIRTTVCTRANIIEDRYSFNYQNEGIIQKSHL